MFRCWSMGQGIHATGCWPFPLWHLRHFDEIQTNGCFGSCSDSKAASLSGYSLQCTEKEVCNTTAYCLIHCFRINLIQRSTSVELASLQVDFGEGASKAAQHFNSICIEGSLEKVEKYCKEHLQNLLAELNFELTTLRPMGYPEFLQGIQEQLWVQNQQLCW